jgi:hypothetical protein
MFVSVWIGPDLDVEKAAIEDELEMAFEGVGEVSGAGVGKTGCHVDVEVEVDMSTSDVYKLVEKALVAAGLTANAKVRVDDEVFLYPRPADQPEPERVA